MERPIGFQRILSGSGWICLCLAAQIVLAGCENVSISALPRSPVPAASTYVLFDPVTVLKDDWLHMPLQGETDYQMAVVDGRLALRAIGRESASGLIRRVRVNPNECPVLEWSWRVEHLQSSADLHVKDRDDVAASLSLLFGDPGFVTNPDPVPTLRYVWTNDHAAKNVVIDNPYMPGVVRNVVIRNSEGELGRWINERRNVVADFEHAFGEKPSDDIQAFALFTDNDQTKQPVEAFYGAARLRCVELPSGG